MRQFVSPVYADGIVNPVIPALGTGSGTEIFGRLLSVVITALLVGGVLASLLNLVIGAYRWMSGGRDKAYLQEARERVFHAVTALIVLFSVFAIIRLVGDLFGINLLEITIPSVTRGATP